MKSTTKRTEEELTEFLALDTQLREQVEQGVGELLQQAKNYIQRRPVFDDLKARELANSLHGTRIKVDMDMNSLREALLDIQAQRDHLTPMLADYQSFYHYLDSLVKGVEDYVLGSGIEDSIEKLRSWARKLAIEWTTKMAEVEATLYFLRTVWDNLNYQTVSVSRAQSVNETEVKMGVMTPTDTVHPFGDGRHTLDDLDLDTL